MAEFTGNPVTTGMHMAVDGDAGTATGADDHRKYQFAAGAGTVSGF